MVCSAQRLVHGSLKLLRCCRQPHGQCGEPQEALVMKAVLSLAPSANGSEKNADCKSIFESHFDPASLLTVSSAKGIG